MSDTAVLEQLPSSLVLRWWVNDPVSLELLVTGVDWSGEYTTSVGGTQLTIPTTAVLDESDTRFTWALTTAESRQFPKGEYPIVVRSNATGAARFAGVAEVRGPS